MAGGKFFSCVSIILANMLVLAVVLKILFPRDVFLWEAAQQVAHQTATGARIIVNYILEKFRQNPA